MGLFGRPKSSPFEGLPPERLAELIQAYKSAIEISMFGKISLMISPGSDESVTFLQELARIADHLDRDASKPSAVEKARDQLQKEVDRFGSWQRAQSQFVIDEFAEAISGLTDCCTNSMEGNDHAIESLSGIEQRLDRVRESNDIVQIRKALTEEVERTRRALAQHQKSRAATRDLFSQRVREMQQKIERAEQNAQTDHLTNLGNRAAFELFGEGILGRTRYGDGPYCVILMDLDNFKTVNDTHGHGAGDVVLNAFSGYLRRAFPKPAFVGRFGGDEFAVICKGAMPAVRNRLGNVLGEFGSKPFSGIVEGKRISIPVGASGGVAEITPEDSLTDVLMRADRALYQAKRNGKGRAAA